MDNWNRNNWGLQYKDKYCKNFVSVSIVIILRRVFYCTLLILDVHPKTLLTKLVPAFRVPPVTLKVVLKAACDS
jgi:hypothetical protein